MSKIKNITVVDGSTEQRVTIPAAVSQIYYNDKNNLNIETTADDKGSNGKGGKINIESASDIQFKPGDDIILYSHHRAEGSQDEVALKVTDGDDKPVKLQINASEMTLTTKDKEGTNANVMDVTVNSGKNTRGYLKVRAQAIDLRSESHGGIALQPKGNDGDGNMNKIKFEHGGGDGLEFGTFNTEKTSIFTDEYRFNKDGIWKMATREKEESDKKVVADPTTHYKYKKQSDDFYDIIDSNDVTATTKDIIKAGSMFSNDSRFNLNHHSIYNIEYIPVDPDSIDWDEIFGSVESLGVSKYAVVDDSTSPVSYEVVQDIYTDSGIEDSFITCDNDFITRHGLIKPDPDTAVINKVVNESSEQCGLLIIARPEQKVDIKTDKFTVNASKIKLGGQLDFGSSFNFGETDKGIEFLYKNTKQGNIKDCGVIKVFAQNNSADEWVVDDVAMDPGDTKLIAQASILDIIKLVNHFKDSHIGPWEE